MKRKRARDREEHRRCRQAVVEEGSESEDDSEEAFEDAEEDVLSEAASDSDGSDVESDEAE